MAEDLVVSGIRLETDALLSGQKTAEQAINKLAASSDQLDKRLAQANARLASAGKEANGLSAAHTKAASASSQAAARAAKLGDAYERAKNQARDLFNAPGAGAIGGGADAATKAAAAAERLGKSYDRAQQKALELAQVEGVAGKQAAIAAERHRTLQGTVDGLSASLGKTGGAANVAAQGMRTATTATTGVATAVAQASGGTRALGEAQKRAALDAGIAARNAIALRESWKQYQSAVNAAKVSQGGMTAAQKAAANPVYAKSVAFTRDRLNEMRASTDRARTSTERLKQSTRSVGTSTGRLDRGITSATGGLQRMAVGLLAVFGAASIVNRALRNMENATRFIVSTNADFQQMTARLRAVTGASAGGTRKMLRDLEEFARTTPFAVDAVTEAFIRLNQLGAEPTIEKMRGLANAAAFAGAGFDDFSNAIVSAVNTSVEPIRQFGASVTVQNDKLVVSFNGITETIPRSVAALTDFFARAGQTGRIAGAAAEQMDTMRGRAAGLRTTLIGLAQDIGGAGLNAELQDTIKWFDDLIQESDDLAISLGSTAAEGVRALRGAIEDLLPIVQSAIGLLADLAGVASVPDIGGKIAQEAERLGSQGDLVGLHDQRVSLEEGIEEKRRLADELRKVQEPFRLPLAPETVNRGLGRAQSVFDLARKNVHRIPGVADDVGLAAREADKELSKLDATIRELEEGLGATKDEIDSIVHPITPPKVAPLGGGTGRKTSAPTDEFARIMERLAEGRKEISAMAAATEGTSIEFSKAEENASLLESTLRSLGSLGEEYAARVAAEWPAIVAEWQREEKQIKKNADAIKALRDQHKMLEEAAKATQRAVQKAREEAHKRAVEAQQKILDAQERMAQRITDSMADAFASIITGTQSVAEAFRQMVQSILAELIRLQFQQEVFPLILSLIRGGGGPQGAGVGGVTADDLGLVGRASGGPLSAGQAAVVGERGPELFVPSTSGNVVPNHALGVGGGETVVQFHNTYEIRSIDTREGVQFIRQMQPEIAAAAAREFQRSRGLRNMVKR